MKAIAELADHCLGKMLDKAKNRGESKPYLRNLNVRWFDFDLSDVLQMRFLDGEEERYTVRKGDLVICEGGYPGRAAVWDSEEPIYIQKALHRVRFHQPAYAKWCMYYLFAEDQAGRLRKHFSGAGIQHFTGQAIAKFRIPAPPLHESQRIVAILDEAFEGIATAKANAEKNLKNARDLVGNGYQAIVEGFEQAKWPVFHVADLAAPRKGSIRTGPFGSQLLHGEFVEDGIAVLGIDNAVANEFRWDRRRYITDKKYQELSRYRVLPGDVLITIMGTCGRCAVVPDDIPLAINTKHLCCITLDRSKCIPEYLHSYFLHNPTAKDYLIAQAKGSIMAGLNMGIISKLPVRLPSLKIQEEIVDHFADLRAECLRFEALQLEKVALLDELKKSLLHEAFSGELTTRETASLLEVVT
jgi:type I restriction enzyme S subunit